MIFLPFVVLFLHPVKGDDFSVLSLLGNDVLRRGSEMFADSDAALVPMGGEDAPLADAPLADLIGGGGGNPTMQTAFANGNTTAIFSDELRKVVLCRDLTRCLPLIPASDDTIFVLPDVVGNIVKELGRHLSYQSRVYLVKEDDQDLVVSEVHTLGRREEANGTVITRVVERWNLKGKGRKTFGAPHIWHRRGDLRGKRLKMFVVDDPPFIDVDYDTGRIGGQNLEMPMELARLMNFTFDMDIRSKEAISAEKTVWDELVEDLVSGKVDMSLAMFYISQGRKDTFSLTVPIHNVQQRLVTWTDLVSMRSTSFIALFHYEVWISLLSTAFAVMAGGALIMRGDWRGWALSYLGVLIGQGTAEDITRVSGRILLLTALLFGVLALNSFAARLISTLSVQTEESLVDDLHGILEHDLTLLIGLGGYTESSFADAPAESIRGRLWRSGNIDAKTTTNDDTMLSNFMDERDLTSTIVANPFVLSAFLDKISRKMRCQVKWHVIQGRLDVGMPFAKDSPYMKTVNLHLLRMEERGFMRRWRAGYDSQSAAYAKDCATSQTDDEDFVWNVGLDSIKDYFFPLAGGVGASLVLAALELAIGWRNKKRMG